MVADEGYTPDDPYKMLITRVEGFGVKIDKIIGMKMKADGTFSQISTSIYFNMGLFDPHFKLISRGEFGKKILAQELKEGSQMKFKPRCSHPVSKKYIYLRSQIAREAGCTGRVVQKRIDRLGVVPEMTPWKGSPRFLYSKSQVNQLLRNLKKYPPVRGVETVFD